LASVEEIASSSADLSHLAEELQNLVGRFKLQSTGKNPVVDASVKNLVVDASVNSEPQEPESDLPNS